MIETGQEETECIYIEHMKSPADLARKMSSGCPAMRVRQVSRIFGKFLDDALRPLGLQHSQMPLLCAAAMAGEQGASIRKLAQVMLIDATTLTRNIRPLEKAGLLRVARSPEDARVRVVILTRSGERMLQSMYPLWQKAVKRIEATFGSERLEGIRSELTEIVQMAGGYTGPQDARLGK